VPVQLTGDFKMLNYA